MIRPPGFRGTAFGSARDGDPSGDDTVLRRMSEMLGIPSDWASLRQVHGNKVVEVSKPGVAGDGDALFTRMVGLPMAVRTADCVPVVIEAHGAAAIVHAGWRGMVAGVVAAAVDELLAAGCRPQRAAVGPSIGPCCYEVGRDVAAQLGGFVASTSWGSTSVDLWAAAAAQLPGLEVWRADVCTKCTAGFHSYRRDGDSRRQASLAWL